MIHRAQNGQNTALGQAVVQLNKILSAPLKKTPSAMLRVYEDFVEIRDQNSA